MFLVTKHFRFNIVLLVLLGTYNEANIATAHRCYVCGIDENLSCDNFDPTNETFKQQCPPDAKGCSTQTHGNTITRSCENLRLKDCETANNIQYCYCYQDLCNGNYINITDDEDLREDGSGITIITSNDIEPAQKDTSFIANESSHLQLHQYTYILITALLCY